MPVTALTTAPYAPAPGVLNLIGRHRSKGLPSPVDADVLGRAGISASLIPRTLQALHTLDLLNDDGSPSAVLEGLRLAPEAEYQQRMAEWLNAAYADALAFIDPADATEVQIRDAFRSYKPVGQQDRMVSLFMGLYTAAGVMPEREKQKVVARKVVSPAPKPTSRGTFGVKVISGEVRQPHRADVAPGMPPALAGLLASLPKDGEGWTQERRDKFVLTFGAVVDFCFPIVVETVGTAAGTSTATAISQ